MTLTAKDLHLPFGSAATDPYVVSVDPARAGWTHTGLKVLDLGAGANAGLHTGTTEMLVVPLAGGCTVSVDAESVELQGRGDVFAGVTDSVYVPRGAEVIVHTEAGGRFALATAECDTTRPMAYLTAADVPVEMRGAGRASRRVHNLGVPDVLDAERLIVCEVVTPAGNWSSWPPHKHDEDREGESVLEEVYYFEIADGPPGPGVGYQRVYGHERADVDVLAEVRSGDVVLVPYGWHGPSMAAPGYDMYYLNVMAGPGERAWNICDDPAHAWVRDTWEAGPCAPRRAAATPGPRSSRPAAAPGRGVPRPLEPPDGALTARVSSRDTHPGRTRGKQS